MVVLQSTLRGFMRTVIVIPTYNEAENLPLIVKEIFTSCPEFVDILIVDDNSPDGTGQIADSLSLAETKIHVLHRTGKLGLGSAYIEGFQWAIAHGYSFIVEMDADGSHPASFLPKLLYAAEDDKIGLVIGSRWVRGGQVIGFSPFRLILSRLGNLYSRAWLRTGVSDCTGGFRVFRTKTLQSIALETVQSQGYCFQVDLTRRVSSAGFIIVEVPIVFQPRRHGVSKMSFSIVLEALINVTLWGLQERLKSLIPSYPR
jgi:dolichol-phosphate mannosyltransferase